MRPNRFDAVLSARLGALATLVLVSPALVSGAAAQMHRGGGGGASAAPHISAPAPHFSAPAAHFSAPAPHFSAPAPHFAAPRMATPHFASPHIAGPRIASPHIAAPSHHSFVGVGRGRHGPPPNFAHGNAGRAVTGARGGLTRHAQAPSTLRQHNGAAAVAGAAAGNRLHGRGAPSSTVAQGPGAPGRNAALHQQGQANRNAGILRNAALSNLRGRDAAARNLSRSTFRGHFAQSGFARDFDRDRHHHRHFGFVLGFAGPLFWPYAYDDFVDYTFWPSAYDTFWPYAYDDVYEGIWGAYAPEYDASYAYAGAPASSSAYYSSGGDRARRGGRARGEGTAPGGMSQICSGDAQGLTDFPIQRIAEQVQPTPDQQPLLDELKAATEKAVSILKAACPNDLPATPTGRLAAMRQRVEPMLQAVQTVRPALEKFYASLNDEQKERFNALDQDTSGSTAVNGQQRDVAQLCGGRSSPMSDFPVAQIERSLHLTAPQAADLQAMKDASAQAADILKENCPTEQALTPPGRLAAMEQRLNAMRQAIATVEPALNRFYSELSDEQKARFNRLGGRRG
jgi:LTXXQ motif family protein